MAKKRYTGELKPNEQQFFESFLQENPPGRRKKAADAPPSTGMRQRSLGKQALSTLVKRGKVKADMILDLHGKTVAEAEKLVNQGLRQAQASHRLILQVITGKGYHSEHGQGVLQSKIPARLRDDPRVAEVVQAVKPKDGGSGAFFVRVKAR